MRRFTVHRVRWDISGDISLDELVAEGVRFPNGDHAVYLHPLRAAMFFADMASFRREAPYYLTNVSVADTIIINWIDTYEHVSQPQEPPRVSPLGY